MENSDFVILIPARKNSKGFKHKNRHLFKHTAKIIPELLQDKTYIFTDDEEIIKLSKPYSFRVAKRDPLTAKDNSTTKDFVLDFIGQINAKTVVLLYLTYPKRTWQDVNKAMSVFKDNDINSLLCKYDAIASPYLMMYELPDNMGKQIINHNLCRRQDYKKCFSISHYISIFNTKEVANLNNNLYNSNTYFLQINKPIDIDTKKDFDYE
jgi:CMP-N,N'-diacetyllegionaminic acid synthase